MYFLETERIGFRLWRPSDVELAVRLWADPKVAEFISVAPATRVSAETRLATEIAMHAAHGVQYWPIFERSDGAHVGCCGLRPHGDSFELGVHIVPAHWRRGFALEAGGAAIRHAFERLGATSLFAGHHPSNGASRALLLALGFTYTHDELYPPTGLLHPSYALGR